MDPHEMRALVARMAQAWMQQDVAAIGALFSDDGVFISPGGVVRGAAAIAATAEAFFEHVGVVEVTIIRVLIDGQAGAVEWRWHETSRATAEHRTMDDAIVFGVADGKITYWREYFDPTQTRPL